ncbi:hypothetical protein [Parenemella sanctibonifatiensis]|uniref:Uncharacterized protein n=1 Tax=Parenemella sanctibonifatiensis TaxID=2016505 RepID=A0A255DY46_9ACTN|nr:hypothetical protein [Parenemella sanctibonifatiensis]OYN84010.1 hypothetical protein CGZ92_13195 [Parenemella sanctibonifatiensis]
MGIDRSDGVVRRWLPRAALAGWAVFWIQLVLALVEAPLVGYFPPLVIEVVLLVGLSVAATIVTRRGAALVASLLTVLLLFVMIPVATKTLRGCEGAGRQALGQPTFPDAWSYHFSSELTSTGDLTCILHADDEPPVAFDVTWWKYLGYASPL